MARAMVISFSVLTNCGNLLSFLLRCGTRPYEKGHPMRLELTRVGLLVQLANHYTTRGAFVLTNCA